MIAKRLFVSLLIVLCLSGGRRAIPIGETIGVNTLQLGGHALDSVSRPVRERDPDAIVYPDEITRDSYGNAVTPFHDLSIIGHMTDVNSIKPGISDRTGSTTDAAGFVIPSYASGITKIETLLPKAPIFPLVAPTKKTVPEISLSNDILPPYKEDEQRINYPHVEVNTQATLFFPDPAFFNNKKPTTNQNENIGPVAVPAQPTLPTTPAPIAFTTTQRSVSNGDIYRGSFGGAPGIIGEPQPLGYYHTMNQRKPATSSSSGHQQVQVLTQPPTMSPPPPSSPSHHQQQPQHGSFLDLNLLPPPPPPPAQKPVSLRRVKLYLPT